MGVQLEIPRLWPVGGQGILVGLEEGDDGVNGLVVGAGGDCLGIGIPVDEAHDIELREMILIQADVEPLITAISGEEFVDCNRVRLVALLLAECCEDAASRRVAERLEDSIQRYSFLAIITSCGGHGGLNSATPAPIPYLLSSAIIGTGPTSLIAVSAPP